VATSILNGLDANPLCKSHSKCQCWQKTNHHNPWSMRCPARGKLLTSPYGSRGRFRHSLLIQN